MTIKTQTVVVDGLSVETTDAGAQAITKLQTELKDAKAAAAKDIEAKDAKIADQAKAIETKDAEKAVLEKKLTDNAITPEMLADAVRTRAAVVDAAKKSGMDEKDMEGMSEEDIKKKMVKKAMGDEFVADKSVEIIDAAWQTLTATLKTSDGARMKDGITPNQSTNGFSDGALARAQRSGLKLRKEAN